MYKDSSWIFFGGVDPDLTEGKVTGLGEQVLFSSLLLLNLKEVSNKWTEIRTQS